MVGIVRLLASVGALRVLARHLDEFWMIFAGLQYPPCAPPEHPRRER
jgi:hypothetical protein